MKKQKEQKREKQTTRRIDRKKEEIISVIKWLAWGDDTPKGNLPRAALQLVAFQVENHSSNFNKKDTGSASAEWLISPRGINIDGRK